MLTLSEHAGCGCVDWDEAARAADALLLHVHRVEIEKALDPLDADDFISIIVSISRDLNKIAGPIEKRHLDKALEVLDVDWASISDRRAERLLAAAGLAYATVSRAAGPALVQTLSFRLNGVGRKTRKSAIRKYKLKIPTRFDAQSKAVVDGVASVQSWITSEYGRRGAMISTNAAKIVSDGLAKGLRSKEITKEIAAMGQRIGVNQSPTYWRIVTDNLANRTRSFAHLASIGDAGISRFTFEAVMDERTTVECRMLHGKVFSVASGLQRLSQFTSQGVHDPMLAETVTPFVKRTRLANGDLELYVQPPGSNKIVVGVSTRSAVGVADKVGAFRGVASNKDLEAAGISVPPIHNGCRSTIVADV